MKISQLDSSKSSDTTTYSNRKQKWKFFLGLKCQNKKNEHMLLKVALKFKNCFDSELLLKDSWPATKIKLKMLLTELKGFKFVATLVLVLKKIESEDKTKCNTFFSHSKQKQLLMKVTWWCLKSK